MNYRPKSERFTQILRLVQSGVVRSGELAQRLSLSQKQTSRLLDAMVGEGLLQKPLRGVYYPSDSNLISFESFAQKQVENMVPVQMSKIYKHNITSTSKKVLIAWEKESSTEYIGNDKDGEILDEKGTFNCPEEVVRRILEICRIETYTREDEIYCVNVLRDVWEEFNQNNIEQIAGNAFMRFATEERAPERNSLAYLCGIARRIVLASAHRVLRNYRQFLRDYPAMAAGLEGCDPQMTHAAAEVETYVAEVAVTMEAVEDNMEPAVHKDSIPDLAPEWNHVIAKLTKIATCVSAYDISAKTIHRVIHGIQRRGGRAEAVLKSLEYMELHNSKGKVYFVNHLDNEIKIDEAIRKNYMWYLNYGLEGVDAAVETKKTSRDSRYSAFYDLFPDS